MSEFKDIFSTVEAEKKAREQRSDNAAFSILNTAKHHWDNLDAFRREGERCHRFVNGDHWSDKMLIYEHGREKWVTEYSALIRQGYNPRTTNLLSRVVNNVLGVVLKNGNEPIAYSVDGNEQAACDVLNTLMQANNTQNRTKLLWPVQFKQLMEWGAIISKETFGWKDGRFGCWKENIDPREVFCDTGMMDVRGWDCNMIGMLHTMSIDDVLSSFAISKKKNPKDARKKHHEICEQYKKCLDRRYVTGLYSEQFGRNRPRNVDFLFPKDGDMCRVIEVWTKETKPRFYVQDYLDGSLTIIEEDEYEDFVEAENTRRIEQAQLAGVSQLEILDAMRLAGMVNADDEDLEGIQMPASCRLRVAEWHEDRYWYYRFMTPNGYVLDEGESPYAHKGHPFVFVFYPFVNGEIRSKVADLIEENKNLNRERTMYDQIVRISMKGFVAYDKNVLPDDDPDGERLTEVLAQPGSSYGFKLKNGEQIQNKVVQMSTNNTGVGLMEMIQMDATNIEDISGVNGALQGKPGYSTTSGALYQQQAQNATGALLEVIESFYSYLMDCAYKQCSNILQCYNEAMVTKVAGQGAWQTLLAYQQTMNSDQLELDFKMLESPASPVYRQIANDYLQAWVQMGLVDFPTALRIGNFPFSDKLIAAIEQTNAAAAAEGGMPLPDRVPMAGQGGGVNASVSLANAGTGAGGGMNDYNRLAQTKSAAPTGV